MPMKDPPALDAMPLGEVMSLLAAQKLPPVDQWNPHHCGDSEMRITRDGIWHHQGSPIGRAAMVRLFSTILRREPDGRHVLVTPAEKLDIDVEDAPFLAIELRSESEGSDRRLAFRLNTGDLVVVDKEHAIRMEDRGHGMHPYLHVRGGLDALIARPVYYELANMALDDGGTPFGLWSNGAFFPMDNAK
ncbi:MAG: DUF1285 domain-containing protein [Alphaproteobacteria bacterium]|nr:DUF1285 domain-containing protein [Alphaproteobacteria bacterium]